jgi:hypothetical protein
LLDRVELSQYDFFDALRLEVNNAFLLSDAIRAGRIWKTIKKHMKLGESELDAFKSVSNLLDDI